MSCTRSLIFGLVYCVWHSSALEPVAELVTSEGFSGLVFQSLDADGNVVAAGVPGARPPLRESDLHGGKDLRALEEILAPLAAAPVHGHRRFFMEQ